MAEAPVNTSSGASASTTALAVPINLPQVGNTLIAQIVSNNSGVTSVTGGGATWAVDAVSGSTFSIEIWRGVVTGAPGTTITINTPLARILARVQEYPGQLLAFSGGITGAGTVSPIDLGSIVPSGSQAVNLLALGHSVVFGTMDPGIGGGFTDFGVLNSGTMRLGAGYLLETAPVNAEPTWTGVFTSGWDALVQFYRAVPYLPSFQTGEISDQVAS